MQLSQDFIDDMRELLGESESGQLIASLDEWTPVSVRFNTSKLSQLPSVGTPVPWDGSAVYLPSRPSFTFDPLFHAGCYYVQEAGSMFVNAVLRQYVTHPVRMLDLCAAPGGKSTLSASVLPEGSLLVANEVVRQRARILVENIVKWGIPHVVVTNNEAAQFAPFVHAFDVILTDVPCSGEGMFRKDPKAVDEWSRANVALCYQRQRQILSDIWPSLKPGGILIYSTCTFNTHEDEENVWWIARELGAEFLPVCVHPAWGITSSLLPGHDMPVYRFLPHKTRAEGFFLAVLRKHGDAPDSFGSMPAPALRGKSVRASGKTVRSAVSQQELEKVRGWVDIPGSAYEFQPTSDSVRLFPADHVDFLKFIQSSSLNVLLAGITVASLKGREFVPHHALALTTVLRRDAFSLVEVDYAMAVAYLRGEALQLPGDFPRGFVLLTYRHHPIGFCKNLGVRANNLYPQEWRIHSSHVPDVSPSFI